MRRKNRQKTAPERAFFSKKSIFSRFWGPGRTQNPPKMATKKKHKKKLRSPTRPRMEITARGQ